MKKISVVIALCVFAFVSANAQYGRMYRYRRYPPRHQAISYFKPFVSLSLGYGFPNLDKDQLVWFNNFYQGSISQTGPIHGSIDYQFSPRASVGVMASYGKVSAPYYDYNGSGTVPAINSSLENWSVMLNLVRYMPVSRVVNPYLRTAIGVNVWNQNYYDQTGDRIPVEEPSMLAYQVSLGAKFHLNETSSLFIEAGYGKYILSAGLAFKL